MANPLILSDNRLLDGVASANLTDSDTNYNVRHLSDMRTYTYWKGASAEATHRIDVTCSAEKKVNCIGIMGHNLKTADATIYVIGSTTNLFTGEHVDAISKFTVTDDSAVIRVGTEITKKYWRVGIETVALAPQIAVLMIGTAITFPNPPAAGAEIYSAGVELETAENKGGHLLGQMVRYKPLSFSLRWHPAENNTTFWKETIQNWWSTYGSEGKPFFFSLDSTKWPDDAFYVRLNDGFRHSINMQTNTRVEGYSMQFQGVWEDLM